MLKIIENLFGTNSKTDYAQLVKKGAIILDVRSKGEFESGHIIGSINIPIDQLLNNLYKLKDRKKPVIVCCASGMRSASAETLLRSNGYSEVYNSGGWSSLKNKL